MKKIFNISILSLLIISTLFVMTSCDKRTAATHDYFLQNIQAIPSTIVADNSSDTYSDIKVFVKDSENNGITGYDVTFKTDFGSITSSVTTTDDGSATATFNDVGEVGTATITATIPNDMVTVQVEVVEPPAYHFASIFAQPDTIYADNNITSSEISVLVKDTDGFAVTGEPVQFNTNIGHIITHKSTDSSGVATTTFWDAGDVGTATINAFVSDVDTSVVVVIDSIPEIDPNEFTLEINSLNMNVDETTVVQATAKNTLGNFVPNGTLISFTTDKGFFQNQEGTSLGESVQVATTNGTATATYNSGTQRGLATITAAIGNVSKSKLVEIHPGSPRFMYLTADPPQTYANSTEEVTISATVEDKYHNYVEDGVPVTFETDLGSITPLVVGTDTLGQAQTSFTPGIVAGAAQVSAVADSAQATTTVSILSDDAHSIEFAFDGQVDIQVKGTGGQESYDLTARLVDMNGNLIDTTKTVWFEMLNYPEMDHPIYDPDSCANINGEDTILVSTESINGEAVVSVNSGYESGIIEIMAYTFTSDSLMISATKSNIVVHSGPPNSVNFSTAGHDSGENMGGGIWKVQVAALLNDMYGNPVSNGTAVYFSLAADSPWVSIEGSAYVGNENTNGDSLAGTAFTFLTYEGSHTNDVVEVSVQVGSFFDTDALILPLQFPVIDMVAIPMHLDWTVAGNDDPKYSQIWVTVMDGQNNPINNQEIFFTSELGIPVSCTYQSSFPPEWTFGDNFAATALTGNENPDSPAGPGILVHGMKFEKYECPAPTPAGPGTASSTVNAQILGTQTTNNVTIILHRYTD